MSTTTTQISRRAFAALAGSAFATLGLAACSSGGGGASGPIKFWNMPWGAPAFATLDKKITEAYKPSGKLPDAVYQSVQWQAFTQTFSTAVASNTGPAVSSGSGTQAFSFAKQGKIAYADHLLDSWKSNGIYDDFLPGILDTMKTPKGYAAVPYNLDMRVLWYSKSLLEKAGADVPTDWQSNLDACAALKKIGVYGFGLSAGAQGNAFQAIVSLMINNGGGIFDEEQKPNLLTPANIQAIEYVQELVRKGYADPKSTGYSTSNTQAQWKAGKFGMQIEAPGLAANLGGSLLTDVVVGEPLTAAAGTKGTLSFPNNIMMYTNTPTQKGSEAFLTYYYKAMAPLWTQKTGVGLPVLKSIAETPEFRSDANAAKIVDVWQPVAKTWAAPGGAALFANVTTVDSTTPMTNFAQTVVAAKTSPKDALTTLQKALVAAIAR
ncbi:ABC transporter substrate-binding protein [Amnibacterium setariae]|uniref:Extracellular solute-binding protein n=1 Tax=Amnibacterium setariae TaxID=2306585 RepID=A0A3A1TZE2_9MICO|nr:extracellular solute-binding protein [Amnibacterium setariae]RIX26390.1 extracellular solute-binding protein [Amnibacterium setariae]